MTSPFAAQKFCKTARCPSSEMLLRYRLRQTTIIERLFIEKHLSACDFCNAEAQLLTRHRFDVEKTPVVAMPSQVRRLAEHLLASKTVLSPMLSLLVHTRQLSH
jgi:hypothetical protein